MNERLRIASMLVAHRYALKKTQRQIAEKLNITHQQVQKYERMDNNISAIKLIKFCNSFDISLQSFQNGDAYQILDGAEISLIKKTKAVNIIEQIEGIHETNLYILKKQEELQKREEQINDQSASR